MASRRDSTAIPFPEQAVCRISCVQPPHSSLKPESRMILLSGSLFSVFSAPAHRFCTKNLQKRAYKGIFLTDFPQKPEESATENWRPEF